MHGGDAGQQDIVDSPEARMRNLQARLRHGKWSIGPNQDQFRTADRTAFGPEPTSEARPEAGSSTVTGSMPQ